MTSENGVIFQQSLILSLNDPRITSLKYQPGDKFTVKKLDDSFYIELRELLEHKQIIIEIQGFGLSHKGIMLYDTHIIEPEDTQLDFHWLLSDKDLEDSFYYLGSDQQSVRFVLIDI